MIEKLFQKAMGFLQTPKAAFSKEKTTELMDAFVYLAILSIVTAVLSGVLSAFMAGPFAILFIVGAYVGGIIGAVIGGLWLHLWAYIFGAKKGLNQTMKTVFFGGTPTYLLGWIPFVNILAGLYSIYIYWIGLQQLQGMPGNKAAMAIVVGIVIPALIAMALFIAGLALFTTMSGVNPNPMIPADFQSLY